MTKQTFDMMIWVYILFLLIALIVIFLIIHIRWMKQVKNGGYPKAGILKKYKKEVEDKLRIID